MQNPLNLFDSFVFQFYIVRQFLYYCSSDNSNELTDFFTRRTESPKMCISFIRLKHVSLLDEILSVLIYCQFYHLRTARFYIVCFKYLRKNESSESKSGPKLLFY